ncbi:MAG: phosphoribosylformylglycinamidine synthase [Tyzzerella sp.]|uniref:Phosphoribosylformylglycinamidine synthase n=1 Tax=Candidatus Fimicola merdigallinarum TaxID=2840819 RepID=A0A9D9H4W5_9FIRM|nr:phosphoribosylformylglycinamidine synthase [Candidatus Fimicola merdigallinarum]
MDSIKRLYVEKKKGCDVEATHLFEDIKESLNITGLTGLRILNRYDIEGISSKDYESAKTTIFAEAPVDIIYEENFDLNENEKVFATEYLPGQYDQRADSAMQCVQLISQAEMPLISVAKVFVLEGELSDSDVDKIKHYCINPVDSREASLEKPESLKMEMTYPEDIKDFEGFIEKSEQEIIDLRNQLETAMSNEDLLFCQKYFRDTEKRNPTETEIRVIDTYWSDHCRHTTFQTKINDVSFEDGFYKDAFEKAYNEYLEERDYVYGDKATTRDINLMDIAVLGMKTLKKKGILDNLDQSEEINACSIVVPVDVDGVTEEWLIMFKNETHNHPTEIEPFGGAATCLGGAIRDPLSGRAYVYQAMRVTGASDPTVPVSETIEGKLPQKKIVTEAARGYSSYGNQIGLATGQVAEVYDAGFIAKRMEIGAVIAATKKENVIREVPKKDDIIILVGGRTGRDGCGGATGSSKEHTVESIETCGAEVQKGNAPTERKLQRLFRNPEVSKMIKRCNDFGAGGVSVAIGELSDGLVINLDAVPKKYEGLDGTELAISESQERMAVVVDKNDVDKFIKFSNEENLEATPVAVVTDDRRLVMKWRGKDIVNISRDFLDTNGATQVTNVQVKMPVKDGYFNNTSVEKILIENDIKSAWIENLKKLNVASQKGLVERFDSTIGANTVLMPFGGKNQLTPPEAMVSKVPMLTAETTTATIMSYGYNSEISKWSPFHSSVYAVIESLAKVVATGGNYESVRLTFQEYFEKLGTDYSKWGKPFSALIGAFQAQMKMGTPAIGGKDSMSGTFMDLTVPPTLVSFAVDVADVNNIISPEFKKAGNKVVYLPVKRDKYDLPDYIYIKEMFKLVESLIKKGICISAHTVRTGGIAEAISKMSFGNYIGVKLKDELDIESLFKPEYGSFVLELTNAKVIDFMGIDAVILGETIPEPIINVNGVEIGINEMVNAWEKPLEKVFPTKTKDKFSETPKIDSFILPEKKFPSLGLAKPKVFIPVFPGTNCEYDSAKAFIRAGADVETVVVNNMSVSALEETILKMEKTIKNSQIIMFPGGFSAGDEPDGSGKFIASAFRNPRIKEAVMNLLNDRDGLILGICNGFQALIKLGLVPYGEIRDIDANSPTLTFNKIGRHVSCLVDTKITSNKSPWLWGVEVGDIHTIPVSHGEGRFVAPKDVIENLIKNGQVATQYVDFSGDATYDIRYNPNGSMMAIEGITSPDGRVFGKMGHSERIGNGLYKNVSGNKNQKIFESGVNYFK